jgi:hypothetical protein
MVITGNVTLTPIAAVDISTTPSGVNMFSLLFPAEALDNGNVIQYEYWLYATSDTAKKHVAGGFIALEDTVSNSGIINQANIAIPSTSNAYDPELSVQIRVFVGSTIESSIQVTEWSNGCPVYNPPEKPVISSAFIYRGEYSTYLYADVLYVILNTNASYDLNKIKFIVSYYYVNESGDNTWIVSAPLAGQEQGLHTIITPIVLADDVSTSEILYVAINAVYQYAYETLLYYTVSEISATEEASNEVYLPPTLDPIAHADYLVYSSPSVQTINLSWRAPDSVLFLPYESYTLNVSVGGIIIDTVPDISRDDTTYQYSILPQYYAADSASVTLTFTLTAIYSNGTGEVSNDESINTFTYASAPTAVVVAWAVPVEGDATKADILFSFKNPSSNGQGTAPVFYYTIYNTAGTVLYPGGPISYVSGVHTYEEYVNNINVSGDEGYVVVHMKTTDTNPNPSGFRQDGEYSSPAYYTITTVPFIQTISYDAETTTLSFEVISSVLLSGSGSIIYRTDISSGLSSLTYVTLAGDRSTLTNGVYKYNFSINIGSITTDPPIEIGITAANTAGIGFASFLIN